MRTSKAPKTIQRWIDKHPHLVEDYHMEDDGFMADQNYSIWLYLETGWVFEKEGEAHCIHEATVKDFLEAVKQIVPCNCEQCQDERREKLA